MRCGFLKRAIWLLALVVPAVFAANYSVTVTYEGDGLYYAIYNRGDGTPIGGLIAFKLPMCSTLT